MHAPRPGLRMEGRFAAVDFVGTWESTAQATWSSSPAEESISFDSAPTPSPNSIFRAETPNPAYPSTALATATDKGLVATQTSCSTCEATASAASQTSDDDIQQRSQQVPLILSVVILSCLILIALLVLGWLRFRRRRRIKQELDRSCLHNDSNADNDSSDVLQEKPPRAPSALSLTGPTLVPDASSSMRTLLYLSPTVYAEHGTQRTLRDPRYSSSTIEDCHPAFMPAPTRALPPIPPPKNRLIPKAPPSSPSISVMSSVPERRASRNTNGFPVARLTSIDTQNTSLVSPVSDKPDSPTVGTIDTNNATSESSSSSSARSAHDVSIQVARDNLGYS